MNKQLFALPLHSQYLDPARDVLLDDLCVLRPLQAEECFQRVTPELCCSE